MPDTVDILRSYVPPLVARRFAADPSPLREPSSERFATAVMFADIYGFTPLAERLAERGSVGAEDLSRLLNVYFGRFIDRTLSMGGEVFQFSGDAAIVLWIAEEPEALQEALLRAAHCALVIQQELNAEEVAPGERLFLKLGLGAGPLWAATVGGVAGNWSFVLAGDPLRQIALCERHGSRGSVLASPEAWRLLRHHAVGRPAASRCVRLERLLEPPPTVALPVPVLESAAEGALRGCVPRPILASLDAGQSGWLAELRRVAVLFVHLPDVDLAREPDEALLERVQSVMQVVETVAERYGGGVNQLVADDKGTVLLLAWGLPALTHEDDALRAAQAALEIRGLLASLELGSAMGLATGRVFCGDRGNQHRREYSMIGDTVNLASRLASAARGSLLCDETTFEALRVQGQGGNLALEALPSLSLKGKTQPVRVFAIRGAGEAVEARGEERVLLGRTVERRALGARLRSLEQENKGGVLLLIGEPGIGKSTLVEDFLAGLPAHGLEGFSGAASSIERTTPYLAWRPVFSQLLDLESLPRNREARRSAVAGVLEGLGSEAADLAALLNPVLLLDFPESALSAPLEGEVRSGNTQRLLTRLLAEAAPAGGRDAAAPRVVVLEDAHWLDSASWALARRVSRDLPELLLVLVCRPMVEPQPEEYRQIAEAPGTQQVHLRALSREGVESLLRERLAVSSVPELVVELIHQRAGGNPFFCEELAYSLRDAGLLRIAGGVCRVEPRTEDLAALVPDSVQAAVATRIDQLSPPQQLTLKVASVLGRVFALRVLRDLYPVPGERPRLHGYLALLEQLDLTQLATPEPDLAYLFKHIITQEVAYDLLLFSQRRELHQAAAQWFESHHGEDLRPLYATLAHHWSRAGVAEKAVAYLDEAAAQALRDDANQEVLDLLLEAEELEESLDEGTGAEAGGRRTRRAHHLAEAYFRLGRLAESESWCRRAIELLGRKVPAGAGGLPKELLATLVNQLGRRWVRPPAHGGSAKKRREARLRYEIFFLFMKISFLQSNTDLTIYSTLNTLRAGEAIGPSPELAHAYATVTMGFGTVPLHRIARNYRKKALETVRRVEPEDSIAHGRVLVPLIAYTSGVGAWEETETSLETALRLFERFGDWHQWGLSMQMLARWAAHQGKTAKLVEVSRELFASGRRRNALIEEIWALNNQVEAELNSTNDLPRALDLVEQARALLATSREASATLITHALTAVIHVRAGALAAARAEAEAALAIIGTTQPTSFGLLVAYAGAALAVLDAWELDPQGGWEAPARAAVKALGRFAEVFPIGAPRSGLYQGRLLWLEGREEAAGRSWRKALEAARRLAMPYERALAHLELGSRPGARIVAGGETRREHLERSVELLEELGVSFDLGRATAALDRLAGEGGGA